jgi:hypothetical protein
MHSGSSQGTPRSGKNSVPRSAIVVVRALPRTRRRRPPVLSPLVLAAVYDEICDEERLLYICNVVYRTYLLRAGLLVRRAKCEFRNKTILVPVSC